MTTTTYQDLIDSFGRPDVYPRFKDGTRRAYRAALKTIQAEATINPETPVSSLDLAQIRTALGGREGLSDRTADSYVERLKMTIDTVARVQAEPTARPQTPAPSAKPVAVNRVRLRTDFIVEVPFDLTRSEADRLAAFFSNMVLD